MKTNRWVYVVFGVAILILAGMVNSWSVLSQPLSQYFPDWSKAQMSFAFTLCNIFFCVGGLIGGSFGTKLKVRYNIWISGVLYLIGFIIASRANTPMVLYVGFGVFAGVATGFVYNSVLSTLSAWFQDKQGFISGILLMGYGLSAFVVGKVYQMFTPAGPGVEAWRTSFFVFGLILLIDMLVCGFVMYRPTKEDIEELGVTAVGKQRADNDGVDVGPFEMIRRKSFWFFMFWCIFMGFTGMAIISQASGVAMEVGPAVPASTIATVAGLISIFNGLGRVFWGNFFDKKGRRLTMTSVIICFLISCAIVIAALITKIFPLIIVGFIFLGFSYGGYTPSISAFVNSAYGKTNYPINNSIMNLNLLCGAFGGTIAGMLYDMSGTYISTIIFMVICLLIALAFARMLKKV